MYAKVDYSTRLKEIELLARALERRTTDIVQAAALDAGFPMKITGMEVKLAVEHLRTMAEEIDLLGNGRPYGTIAAILPYDAPVFMLARLGGSALLTGNRLRFSFSSQTPRSADLLAEICKPVESLEPVLRQDNREFGRRCVKDETVRVLFISGASSVGETYRNMHHAFDKVFFAGPGGMPAAVVFKDADATAASGFIARRAFINGGQYCTTLKKALIHREHYETVRDQILRYVHQLRVGDPLDPETDIGPIKVERTRTILQHALDNCRKARLLSGAIKGEFVYPLVLEMEKGTIPDLELFGPFLVLKPFDDLQEEIDELTQTRYGFLLAFFGSPSEATKRLFHQHFGMVYDNPDFFFTPLRLPFGGKKGSGWILERHGTDWIERNGAFLYSRELVLTPYIS